jgi:hypothetical protein
MAGRLIRMRVGDGRDGTLIYDVPPAIGVWRPTPPAFAPFSTPWMARVDPLVLRSMRQFRPGPPPPIDSALYVEEFEEVRDYGARVGSLRTPEQTETARFFTDVVIGPFQSALRDMVTRRGLDISASARLFAAVEVSMADAVGAAWDGKYHYAWWRPVTAIHLADEDGNPATTGVPDWVPLLNTPPYPDWPSQMTLVLTALSRVVERLSDDGSLDLYVTSVAAGVTRHYDDAAVLQQDVIDARVWLGIHFRTADEVARDMGVQIADWALDHNFAPAG